MTEGAKERWIKAADSPSDGYHTFDELYAHRIALFILLAKFFRLEGGSVYRFHHYDGWFCLGLETDVGQISYHLPEEKWDECSFAKERQPEFDGHTSDDVLHRLNLLLKHLSDVSLKEITCPHCNRDFIDVVKGDSPDIFLKQVTCPHCNRDFFTEGDN